MKTFFLGVILLLVSWSPSYAAKNEWEYELDAYYSSLAYTVNLTTSPIPTYDSTSEWEIYKRLMKSPRPRYVIFEASANPLPLLGVYLKRQARAFYNNADYGKDQNIIQSVTTGFEEPGALSIFVGNVVDYKPVKKRNYGEGKGYIGYLLSVGNYHIKDNDLIKDDWIEAEAKIKGDRKKSDVKLQWSFRLGTKYHTNREIADVYYIGFRRSRVDYGDRRFSLLRNSGIMYKFDFDARNLSEIQHQLVLDKKFPTSHGKIVPTMAIGFLYRTRDKYNGSLESDQKDFRLLLQPNIEF